MTFARRTRLVPHQVCDLSHSSGLESCFAPFASTPTWSPFLVAPTLIFPFALASCCGSVSKQRPLATLPNGLRAVNQCGRASVHEQVWSSQTDSLTDSTRLLSRPGRLVIKRLPCQCCPLRTCGRAPGCSFFATVAIAVVAAVVTEVATQCQRLKPHRCQRLHS